MIRLAVSVEGETEEDFVNGALASRLQRHGVYATPILLGRARYGVGGGGDVRLDRLAAEMRFLQHSFDAVTSLVDFYGFRDKGSRTVDELVLAIQEHIGQCDERFVFPYVQLHEFEGLLFSDVRAFGKALEDVPLTELVAIRSEFPTPDDINDDPATAPSKRIGRLIPHYRKRLHGPLIADEIGVDTIRNECARFDVWLRRLESLGELRT